MLSSKFFFFSLPTLTCYQVSFFLFSSPLSFVIKEVFPFFFPTLTCCQVSFSLFSPDSHLLSRGRHHEVAGWHSRQLEIQISVVICAIRNLLMYEFSPMKFKGVRVFKKTTTSRDLRWLQIILLDRAKVPDIRQMYILFYLCFK